MNPHTATLIALSLSIPCLVAASTPESAATGTLPDAVVQAIINGDIAALPQEPAVLNRRIPGFIPTPMSGERETPKDGPGVNAGGNALLLAAALGRADVVRYLLPLCNPEAADARGRTSIVYAAAAGHTECVRLLLESGARQTSAALEKAAFYGHHEVVDLLLAHGVQPGQAAAWSLAGGEPHDGLLRRGAVDVDFAMQLAVEYDRSHSVHALLKRGVNVKLHGAAWLMLAAKEASPYVLKTLVRAGVNPQQKVAGYSGCTPLIWAARWGNEANVSTLLKLGTVVTPEDREALQVQLFWAVGEQQYAAIRQLLRLGANPRYTSQRLRRSALQAAQGAGDAETLRLLRAADFPFLSLHDCVRQGTPEQLEHMLAHPDIFPVEAREDSRTPLMVAVSKNTPRMVRMLIAAGADVNAMAFGSPVLHTYDISPEVMELLLRAGADTHAFSCYVRRNALGYHISRPEILRLLLKHGCSASAPCYADGRTPLMLAVASQSVEGVQLLLAQGADVNARDAQGQTALHRVKWTSGKSLQIARLLLEHGADVNARDIQGRTPLLTSPGIGSGLVEAPRATADLLELYLSAGADLHVADNKGCNALEYALCPHYASSEMISILRARGLTARADYELFYALNGDEARVQELLAAGANPNTRRPQADAEPALAHCQGTATDPNSKAAEMVELLLAAGAEADAEDAQGNTPLMSAVRWGSLRVAELLLAAGANPRRCDYVDSCRHREYRELVSTLLRAGATPAGGMQPAQQVALVHALAEQGDMASLSRLVVLGNSPGFRVDAPLPDDTLRRSALMLAAQRGDMQVVRVLLSLGASAARQDAQGNNAMDYAAQAGHPDVVGLLRKTGVLR